MVRKRVTTLGLVLGLAVNQIILYQSRAISAEEYVIPQYLMDDIKKNVGTKNNVNSNNQVQNSQTITIDKNISQQPQSYQYSKQISIENNVNTQPVQVSNNNYNYEQANNYDPNRPEWKDFAPYGWDSVTLDPKEGTYWNTVKMQQAAARHYWYDRRQDFERDLVKCDSLQGDYKYACYEKLKIRQSNINEQKKQKDQEYFVMQLQRQQQQAQAAQQLQASIQAAAAAEDARNFQREQMNQQMMMNYMQNSPFKQQPKYRFYDQYGRSYGYVQQSNW